MRFEISENFVVNLVLRLTMYNVHIVQDDSSVFLFQNVISCVARRPSSSKFQIICEMNGFFQFLKNFMF